METIEHFATISLVARLLGGERVLSREEVDRLQGLRGRYGIASPAPICADPPGGAAECQTVLAPSAPGHRLVPDRVAFSDAPGGLRYDGMAGGGGDPGREIRLTYGELTALIEDAVRQLK